MPSEGQYFDVMGHSIEIGTLDVSLFTNGNLIGSRCDFISIVNSNILISIEICGISEIYTFLSAELFACSYSN